MLRSSLNPQKINAKSYAAMRRHSQIVAESKARKARLERRNEYEEKRTRYNAEFERNRSGVFEGRVTERLDDRLDIVRKGTWRPSSKSTELNYLDEVNYTPHSDSLNNHHPIEGAWIEREGTKVSPEYENIWHYQDIRSEKDIHTWIEKYGKMNESTRVPYKRNPQVNRLSTPIREQFVPKTQIELQLTDRLTTTDMLIAIPQETDKLRLLDGEGEIVIPAFDTIEQFGPVYLVSTVEEDKVTKYIVSSRGKIKTVWTE